MNTLAPHARSTSRATVLLWLLVMASAAASPARAIDFDVHDEADYTVLMEAVRGAEYTRQRYLEGSGNPRVLVSVVGLWVYADCNPLATPQQLAAFLAAYDAQLATMLSGDPKLSSYGSALAAIGSLRLSSSGELEGTDTRVGDRVIELLGIELPGLETYEQSRLRMSRFDQASVRRLAHRSETSDALTAVLAGIAADGNRIGGLAQTAATYLTAQGYAPMLGQIDPTQTEINAGLANLPSYAEFVALRDDPNQAAIVEAGVFADIDAIQIEGMRLLNDIGTPQADLDLFADSLSRTLAAADPDDPDHDAALADIEARRAAIVQSIRNTAAERARVFARTMLLQQSAFAETRSVATIARSFAGLQLQTNNDLAIAQQGVELGGSLIGIAAGLYNDDPWGAVQSLTNLVGSAIGLADLLGDGPPSPEQQIFDQIIELRQQVEDMRVQLNSRFDVVDARLDQIFSTMTTGFAALGSQIGDLQESVDALTSSIAEARSSLDRIEDALFGFAQEILLADLSVQTNLVLNYRDNTGADLEYANSTPSFVGSASFFHTFATSTAKGASFAGTPDEQPMVLTLDNAAATLGETALARRINDLRRVPTGLMTSAGVPVSGPITVGRVAAPAPWSQAAAAYAQLARESPWYFAFLLGNQGAENPNAQINQLIADGERIANLANATRARTDLFDALLHRADLGTQTLHATIIDRIDANLPAGYSNGSTRVDAWGTTVQTASPLLLPITAVQWQSPEASGTLNLATGGFAHRGHEITTGDNRINFPPGMTRAEIAERNALSHLFEVGPAERPRPQMLLNKGQVVASSGTTLDSLLVTLRSDSRSQFPFSRYLYLSIEARLGSGPWQPLDFVPIGVPAWQYMDFVTRAWPQLGPDLRNGNLQGRTYSTGTIFSPIPLESRIRVASELSDSLPPGAIESFNLQTIYVTERLASLRGGLRLDLLDEFSTPGSALDLAGQRLDNDAALLDAYLGLGMADALSHSELLRSAFRGVPGIGGLGFRKGDAIALIQHEASVDDGSIGGIAGAGLPFVGQHLHERILGLGLEIEQAQSSSAPSFPYVEYVLADLRELRDQASNAAIDETYALAGTQTIPASQGLMANDVGQGGRIGAEELVIDLAWFASPAAVLPAHGSITVQEDGAFGYMPDPGYSGPDRFTYRLRANILTGSPDVFSTPATVILRVGDASDTIFADGFD